MLLRWQNEVAGSVQLQGSLESSVAQLQQNLKQQDVDCSKMTLEIQVSCITKLIVCVYILSGPPSVLCRKFYTVNV